MFGSLRIKIFLLVFVVLAIVAFAVMQFSRQDVEQAVLAAEERSARNVLELVTLNIKGSYQNLLREKMATVKRRKERVRELATLVIEGLNQFQQFAQAGHMDAESARQAAYQWLGQIQADISEKIMVVSDTNRLLFHADQAQPGRDISALVDLKGRPLAKTVRDKAQSQGSIYVTYRWYHAPDQAVMQFGYFTYFGPWNWTVGATALIGDVEQETQQRVRELVTVLRDHIPRIHIAQSGAVVIFSGEEEILVAPEKYKSALPEARQPNTQRSLLKVFMEAARTKNGGPVLHTMGPSDRSQLESYVAYVKPLDWYVATIASREEIAEPANRLISRQGLIFTIVLAVGLVLAALLAGRIVRPLRRLTEHARQLPEQDFTAKAEGPSPVEDLPVRLRDEVGRLAQSFIYMESSLRENIRDLMKVSAAKQRLESELQVAHDIQMGLVPEVDDTFSERSEFELSAFLEPAREVGGDLYDFFFVDSDRLWLVVGDVSDKGVPAALYMAVTRTMIKALAAEGRPPAEVATLVNDALAVDNPRCMFVTLFLAVLDLQTGKLAYANAGHNPPLILRPGGEPKVLDSISGPMAGAIMDVAFKGLETSMQADDTLVVYTDGVTEAMDVGERLYSEKRLLQSAAPLAGDHADQILDAIRTDVRRHAGSAPQSDDIAMLCLRYLGPRKP